MKFKFNIILSLIFLLIGKSYSQFSPKSYILSQDKIIGKVSSATPSNNSISDIIIVGDTVWLGSDSGVSLSTDKGATWTNFDSNPAFAGQSISAIGYNQYVFWAATATSEISNGQTVSVGTGLKYTTDYGKTWISVSQPIDKQADTIVAYGNNKLRALPVTVPEQNLIYDIAFTPGAIWIASFAGGLRKSLDMGKTWQRVVIPPDFLDSISPSDTLDFCMQPVAGAFCSENNLNYRVFSVISINDSTVYVGTADGINKSTDAGSQYPSWTKFTHTNESNPISGNFVTALGYNKSDSTVWGATWQADGATEFYGVSSSSDGGNNWKTFLNGEKVHNFAFRNGGEVIAPSDDGAFRTSDNGNNWVIPTSITDASSGVSILTNIAYSSAFQGNSIWVGTADGLARIDENGSGLWQGSWKVFYASQPVASQSQTYAFPNPFDPQTDNLRIKFSTNGQLLPVTIRIFNFSMHIIRTVIENAERNYANDSAPRDTWDGKDDNGNIVPNGVYFYRIDAGSNKPVFGKILVIQ